MLSSALFGILFIGTFILLQRVFKHDAGTNPHQSLQSLKSRFLAFDLKMQGIGLALLFSIATSLFFALKGLVMLNGHFQSDALYLILPKTTALFVCAMFSGMALTFMLYLFVAKKMLKQEWKDFVLYNNLKYGFNYLKASRAVILIIAILGGVATFLVLDSYTAFTENEVRFNTFFGFGAKTYSYADVSAIKDIATLEAPNGKIVNDPHFVIEFADGQNWKSRDSGFSEYHLDMPIAELVSQKCGLPIIRLEIDK